MQEVLSIHSQKIIINRKITGIASKNLPYLFQKLSSNWKELIYFSKPEDKFSFLAIGKLNIPLTENNYTTVDVNNLSYAEIIPPLFVGYQKFSNEKSTNLWDDFKLQEWYIPNYILLNKGEKFFFIKNYVDDDEIDFLDQLNSLKTEVTNNTNELEENSFPNYGFEEWNNQIQKYLLAIKNKKVEKAVLARQVIKDLKKFSSGAALKKIQDNYPLCVIFGIKSNDSIFWGASPEKLCSINNSELETEAIAGSAPRGNSLIEDKLLEEKLLSNSKELREHLNVVKFIEEKLSPIVSGIKVSKEISVKKLNNIQHLKTKITANLKYGINILDAIKVLHPTPAVCGYPREEAFRLINHTEDFDRGLYSGIIGWFDENLNGEFVVALRSALVKQNKLYAYAGCGIVEGSNPISEFNETELKLKPILSLFENENKSK